MLKEKLTSAPILSYPSFDKPFVLESDTSIKGIESVLSQSQADGLFHPVAYASHSFTPAQQNYSIIDLWTLAVVWAIEHFVHYLYGYDVTVLTNHTAVNAILQILKPTGKHACWCT